MTHLFSFITHAKSSKIVLLGEANIPEMVSSGTGAKNPQLKK